MYIFINEIYNQVHRYKSAGSSPERILKFVYSFHPLVRYKL